MVVDFEGPAMLVCRSVFFLMPWAIFCFFLQDFSWGRKCYDNEMNQLANGVWEFFQRFRDELYSKFFKKALAIRIREFSQKRIRLYDRIFVGGLLENLHPRNLIPKLAIFKRSHLFRGPSFWYPAVSFQGVSTNVRKPTPKPSTNLQEK